jgi:hypothetical protein
MTADVDRLLKDWLAALQAGEDPHQITRQVEKDLIEAGAPIDVVTEVARLGAIATIDKKLKLTGWDEKQVALFKAQRAMLAAQTPVEETFPLIELHRDLRVDGGAKPRKLGYRVTLAVFAAAVTVLKTGQTVDEAIAEIATPNGIDRKDIRNYRDRLNRGLVTDGTQETYKLILAAFKKMPRAEMMAILARTAQRFCT